MNPAKNGTYKDKAEEEKGNKWKGQEQKELYPKQAPDKEKSG